MATANKEFFNIPDPGTHNADMTWIVSDVDCLRPGSPPKPNWLFLVLHSPTPPTNLVTGHWCEGSLVRHLRRV